MPDTILSSPPKWLDELPPALRAASAADRQPGTPEYATWLADLAEAAALAVADWIGRRYADDPRMAFDEAAASAAESFFPTYLRHAKGQLAGRPFELDRMQRAVVRATFGWKWRATGRRVVRTLYLFVARKNGKSTFFAGLALLLLIADGERGAEVYSAALDRDQAGIVFRDAASMVRASPALSEATEIFKTAIVCPALDAAYKVLSAEAETKHGYNPHGVIFDELHTQRSRDLYDVLHTGTGARLQSLEAFATTAGVDKHSICAEVHDYALKVRSGAIDDPSFLPVLFMAPADMPFDDPRALAMANPSLGRAVQVDYLLAEVRKAVDLPSYENTFRRLHLNQWTEQVVRWLPLEAWDEAGRRYPFAEADLDGRACWGGLDLSSTQDLSALVLVFEPTSEADPWLCLARFWCPAEGIRKRALRDRVPYDEWARRGLITATEGDVVDYDRIRSDVRDLARRFRIREIAYDRWNATQIVTQLGEDGAVMVPFGQGFASMSAPAKQLERLVVGRRLAHAGHPVLRWMAANVAVKTDPAGNIKPCKESSGEKIDGIVALVMALGRATARAEAKPESVYAKIARLKGAALADGRPTNPIGSREEGMAA